VDLAYQGAGDDGGSEGGVMITQHRDRTTAGPRGVPPELWGERVSEGMVAVTLRLVTEDEVVTVPISALKRWQWTTSSLGTERLILWTSQERIQVHGTKLEAIHRLLDALRVRELRVSRGSVRDPALPWIERIVFAPLKAEGRQGRTSAEAG
jgi:hypothetical protein